MEPSNNIHLLMLALEICATAHKNQYDMGGRPYAEHPMRLAARIDERDTDAKIVALLHDVPEDTLETLDTLKERGFTYAQRTAIKLLTRIEGQDYFDYIRLIEANGLATRVKILDLEDNMNLSRLLATLDNRDLLRIVKYHKAYLYLTKQVPFTYQQSFNLGVSVKITGTDDTGTVEEKIDEDQYVVRLTIGNHKQIFTKDQLEEV